MLVFIQPLLCYIVSIEENHSDSLVSNQAPRVLETVQTESDLSILIESSLKSRFNEMQK